LSASVEQALEKKQIATATQATSALAAYQAVPELKSKLTALDKLPLVRHVIERALGRAKTNFTQTLL